MKKQSIFLELVIQLTEKDYAIFVKYIILIDSRRVSLLYVSLSTDKEMNEVNISKPRSFVNHTMKAPEVNDKD